VLHDFVRRTGIIERVRQHPQGTATRSKYRMLMVRVPFLEKCVAEIIASHKFVVRRPAAYLQLCGSRTLGKKVAQSAAQGTIVCSFFTGTGG